MRYFLFAPTISYWQYLTMSAAVLVAALMRFDGYAIFAWLGIVIVGGAIEGIADFISDSKK
ncbi:hypothetical protein ACW582_16370 [Pseudomonas chlororaphis]